MANFVNYKHLPACTLYIHMKLSITARLHVLHAHGCVSEQLHSVCPLPLYPPHYSRSPLLAGGCECYLATHSFPEHTVMNGFLCYGHTMVNGYYNRQRLGDTSLSHLQ